MRYWFTNETSADPLVFNCDYAQVSCSNITTRFVSLATPVAGKANAYAEYSFGAAAGSIAAGGNGGGIPARGHPPPDSDLQTAARHPVLFDPGLLVQDNQGLAPSFHRNP